MWAKLKDVAAARNRWNAGFGRERPELSSVNFIVKDNMIDFVESKSRYFYWRLCDYEFLKLDLQTSKVPLAFFRKAIEGKTQQPRCVCRSVESFFDSCRAEFFIPTARGKKKNPRYRKG